MAPDCNEQAILVTGASTGIGRYIAETLAANGHFVYAGARKQTDLDALSAIENIDSAIFDTLIRSMEHRGQAPEGSLYQAEITIRKALEEMAAGLRGGETEKEVAHALVRRYRAVKTPNLPFQLRLQGFDAVSLSWFKLKHSMATNGLGRIHSSVSVGK